ncbi:EAL domain-containing protein [Enterococcus sp. DIV0876]|uniref:EAL domain-containing protein n=1 Tax=Enterococcus sp. DIV0876 TaxID=2774633 RepID=UPI003D3005C8
MNYDELKFYGQGIHHAETKEIVFFELLLRKEADKNIFPKDAYLTMICQQEEHKQYVKWLQKTLPRILLSNPTQCFSFNIDPQELEYEETFVLLDGLKTYKQRLIIEITEKPPIKRNYPYFSAVNVEAFKKIADFGYRVAMDDIGQGINSLDNVLELQHYFQIIKFSSLSFQKKVSEEILQKIIVLYASVADQLDKTFVVEGIENQKFAHWLETNISCYHQGYLYSTPENILTIDY